MRYINTMMQEYTHKNNNTTLMNFTKNRSQHSLGVARYMFKHAPSYRIDPMEAFLVGWLHDIGYETGNNRTHAEIGGSILKSQGYKYWKEITMHGTIQGLISNMGILLNQADMSIDSTGEEVGFEARLHDISLRYGKQSIQYQECSTLIEELIKIHSNNQHNTSDTIACNI